MFNRVCIFLFVLYSVELHSQKIEAKLIGQEEDLLSFQVNFHAITNCNVSLFDDKSNKLFSNDYSNPGNELYTIGYSDLKAAEIYRLVIWQNDTIEFSSYYVTKSWSSGNISNYFDHELAPGDGVLNADGTTFGEAEKAIKDLLKSAKTSIDYCVYNTNVTSIVNNLIDAKNRGVRVRVITDKTTTNSGFDTPLPFSVLKGNDDGIMHNKFIVVDAESVDAKVVTGTMNFTTGQMKTDPNHFMIIEDQSLAKAYMKEFEEMWGSSGSQPNLLNDKFGKEKIDNTPHEFTIGDRKVLLYFSPSDLTSQHIISNIEHADYSLDAGLLLFTYDSLLQKLLEVKSREVGIRVILEDRESSSDVVGIFDSENVPYTIHETNGIYHYKTAIIDAGEALSMPTLITGSHNWTWSAEHINDENTIIIEDNELTLLYKKAFEFWWRYLNTSTTDLAIPKFVQYNSQSSEIIVTNESGEKKDFLLYDCHGSLIVKSEILPNTIQNVPFYVNMEGVYFCMLKGRNDWTYDKIVKL